MPTELMSDKYWILEGYDYYVYDIIELFERMYFYSNRLILDCKAAAPNLTPAVWESIEDRMLKPPTH